MSVQKERSLNVMASRNDSYATEIFFFFFFDGTPKVAQLFA